MMEEGCHSDAFIGETFPVLLPPLSSRELDPDPFPVGDVPDLAKFAPRIPLFESSKLAFPLVIGKMQENTSFFPESVKECHCFFSESTVVALLIGLPSIS